MQTTEILSRKASLRELVAARDELTEKTGRYFGLEDLLAREEDPIKFEKFYSEIHNLALRARESARFVAASPGGREMGESLWSICTPEGDTLANSLGFLTHMVAYKQCIKYMAEAGFEDNPEIRDGDIFATDDGAIGGAPHPGDTYSYMPIFFEDEIVGWAAAVNHIMEAGAPVAGSWPGFSVDTTMDGLVFPPMKVGENRTPATWWNQLWMSRTRAGTFNVLDDKMRLAGNVIIVDGIRKIVASYGIEYYRRATREVIEFSRRAIQNNIKTTTVPGIFTGASFRVVKYKGLTKIWPHADNDYMLATNMTVKFGTDQKITADFTGTSRWDYCAFNGYPGGADIGFQLPIAFNYLHNTYVTSAILYDTKARYPKGSSYNPDSNFAAYSNIWAQSIAMAASHWNCHSRSMFARGFLEESFTVDGVWGGIQGGGRLANGQSYGFTNFEMVGGVAQGAFSFKDGIPIAYALWTQLTNIGNVEEWEFLIPPMFYLGRSLVPDFCGHGKYRGGVGLSSVHLVLEPGKDLYMSRGGSGGSQTTHVSLGLSGGYPPPGTIYTVIRKSNLLEKVQQGMPYPRNTVECLDYLKEKKFEAEDVQVFKYDPPQLAMKHGDIFTDCAGGSGGWGDPQERDPQRVIADLNEGWVSERLADSCYGVVGKKVVQGADSVYVLDEAGTSARRKEIRAKRLACPTVKDWWKQERLLVKNKQIIEPVRYTLQSTFETETGPEYKKMFIDFWQLDENFNFIA